MDIVERLNKWLWAGSPWVDTMGEAASEITRLREENKAMREALEWYAEQVRLADITDSFLTLGLDKGNLARTALATTGGE